MSRIWDGDFASPLIVKMELDIVLKYIWNGNNNRMGCYVMSCSVLLC